MHRYSLSAALVGCLVLLPLATPPAHAWLDPADAAVITVKDTADNQFSFYAGPGQQTEWLDNHGASASIRLKGAEDMSGFKFDLHSYKGKTVQNAELHLARANTDAVYSLVAATINTDWDEATACLRYRANTTDWTFPHGDFTTATFGNYGSLVSFGYAADDTFKTYTTGGKTWIAMKLDPALVQALILDQPGGLVVTDPRGHQISGSPTNPTVSAREAGTTSQPRLYIKFATATDTTPPGAIAALAAQAGPEDGQVVLHFTAPTDPDTTKAFGYIIRYGNGTTFNLAKDVARWRIPRPAAPGTAQSVLIENLIPGTSYTFFVQAYDAVGNASPVQSDVLQLPAARPIATLATGPLVTPNPSGKTIQTVANVLRYWAASEVAKINPVTGNRFEDGYTASGADNYKKANPVWNAGTNTISLLAANNEVVAAQLILERLGATLTSVNVTVGDLSGPSGASIPAAPNIELFQLHYVSSGGTSYPDAAIPLQAPFPVAFNIPDAARNPTGKNQSVWMDIYVPAGAPAGTYTGTITVTASQLSTPLTVNLQVDVYPVAIPDYPTFLVDLNGYGAPWDYGTGNNLDLTSLRYFQAAHKHRAMANILPYGWSGSTRADRRPTLTGAGPTLRAADWTAFDARYGGIFDGSAFTPTTANSPYTGPGMSTPVTHFYTTFHEMWPVSLIDSTYGFDAAGRGGSYWNNLIDTNPASFFATAPDIYPAFPDGYKQGNRNVLADWLTHAQSSGWTRTAFQCYLNNKYYYNGSYSLWELEECSTGDDFRAVGFLHQLYREGQTLAAAPPAPWHCRLDISDRWGQNYGQLDNRINWFCMGSGAAGWHWPNKEYRKYVLNAATQEQWVWYGLGAPIASAGIGNARAFLQKWSQGFDGGLPYWDNYQTSWTSPNDLSTVYSGQAVPGSGQYEGPVISIRIKALRQVQQIIELLNLWAAAPNLNRQRARDAAFARYGTPGTWDYAFDKLDELALYKLHADLLAQLGSSGPAPTGGQLQVTPASGLVSTGPLGGLFNPGNIVYTLTNIGTAPLTWTAATANTTQPWLTLSKTAGTLAPGATDTVTAAIDPVVARALAVGTYTDTISFTNTSNHNGDTTRSASLTVTGTATAGLQVTPATGLASTGPQGGPFTPASIDYTLTNTGKSSISWTAAATASWLTLSKTAGTLAPGATDTVTVSINTAVAATLTANTYTDTITFTNTTDGTGNTTRTATLTVSASGPAGLNVTPLGNFSSNGPQGGPFFPASITYTLTNTGNAAINWSAAKTQPWLTLSKTSGSLPAGATDTVVVTIDPALAAALALGTYTDTITFTNTTDGTGNTTRAVTLVVRQPIPGTLQVLPAGNLTSSGPQGGPFSPLSITYHLTNIGDTALNWTAAKTAAWLTLSNTGTTLAPAATDTVVVAIDATAAAALSPGDYTDTVTFTNTTNGTGNTTRTARLIVAAAAAAGLSVSPDGGLSAAGPQGGPFHAATVTFTLSNDSQTPITWTATTDQPWLLLSDTTGTLAAGASDTVTAWVGSGANLLPAGSHFATITFTNTTDGVGDTIRSVSLIIAPPPGRIIVAPHANMVSSGGHGDPFSPLSAYYTITNPGGRDVHWLVTKTQPWLSLTQTGGILPAGFTDSVTVMIGADQAFLAYGMYADTVTITNFTNGDGTTTRDVTLAVVYPGDVDGDGVVGIMDVLKLIHAYGASAGDSAYDIRCDIVHDDQIDMSDLLALIPYFGMVL